MTKDLRWRILILQAIIAGVFAVGAFIAFKEARFARDYVHDQLVAQKIFFPQAGAANFKPEDYPELQQYAGQQVDNGPKAKAYANGYIGRHLQTTAEGRTYSEQSTFSRQNPQDTKAAEAVQTLFRGETLRGMLLNAWGWWTIGTYTYYAGVLLVLATIGVLGAFAFELVVVPRRRARSRRRRSTHAATVVLFRGTRTRRAGPSRCMPPGTDDDQGDGAPRKSAVGLRDTSAQPEQMIMDPIQLLYHISRHEVAFVAVEHDAGGDATRCSATGTLLKRAAEAIRRCEAFRTT